MPLCSPASPQRPATETRLSPAQPQPDPAGLHHSPAAQRYPTKPPHSPEPRELPDDIAQLCSDSTEFHRSPEHMELRGSPAALLAEAMDAPQALSEPAKLQTTAVSPQASPETKPASIGPQGDPVGANCSPAEHPEGPTLAHDHGPAEMQHSSAQLSPRSSSAVRNPTEDQLIATASPPSPVHCSSTLCSDAHSPPSPVQLQPGSASRQTPPADSPCQQSLLVPSPAPQLPQPPTHDCGPPPDHERSGTSTQVVPRSRDAHPDCSPLCGRSATGRKADSPKPLSAPCSPSPSQPPPRCSVSQPASPVPSQFQMASSQLAVQSDVILNGSQEELGSTSIQTGLADQRQTVDNCLASVSPVSSLSRAETGDELSVKRPPAGSGHSPAQSSLAPSHCTESDGTDQKSPASPSPPQSRQKPAPSGPAGPSPASDGSSTQPSSLLESPGRSPEPPVGSQAGTPRPTSLRLFQSDDGVAAHHPHPSGEPGRSLLNSSPDSLDHGSIVSEAARISDAPGDPVHHQDKMVCASAEDTQTDGSPTSPARPSCASGLTPTLTSCRPSAAGKGSPLHVENTSKSSPSPAPCTQSSLAPTTTDPQSSPPGLAQSSHICCGSHQSSVPHTEHSPGPGSGLHVDLSARLFKSLLPDLLQLESGPNKPDSVGEMIPEPAGSSLYTQPGSPESAPHTLELCEAEGHPGSGSSSPPCLSFSEAAPSPRSPGSPSPTQVTSSKPRCSSIPEASACAQARSPHTGTSSPAGQLQTADAQVQPSPGSSPSEEPPSTAPGGPAQKAQAPRESAAAEGIRRRPTGHVGKSSAPELLSSELRSQLLTL